ncbi:hypothetical protein [Ralstonia solanacearum]|uniref:hypothetical protein n=1 Tax=Ralstonia solanacearum TaxID=305 RepID=UPI001E3AD313|nr:hypothetical protein [Ralstonia solanacearum]
MAEPIAPGEDVIARQLRAEVRIDLPILGLCRQFLELPALVFALALELLEGG